MDFCFLFIYLIKKKLQLQRFLAYFNPITKNKYKLCPYQKNIIMVVCL